MKIDSHQHFWRYSAESYPWIQPGWPIRRDFLPPDLEPLLDGAGLDGSIAVQARQSLEENDFLLALADRNPRVLGVVGWADLRSHRVEESLASLSRHPRFVGVRHVAQDEPDDRFLAGEAFMRGIGRLRQFRLTYDILIFPKQLPAAIELVSRFPEQRFVLDHIAKPLIRDGILSPWREQIRELARHPGVLCKVSGMVTEARCPGWKAADFQAYWDVVWEAFGPERLMYGSDWPVALLGGEYRQVFDLATGLASQMSASDRDRFFGGNAERFYLQR